MLYSSRNAMHTGRQPALHMTSSLSESCLEGMLKGGEIRLLPVMEHDLHSKPKPFVKTLKSIPTDTKGNLRRCVSLPPSSCLEREHTKQSSSSLASTTFQKRKNLGEGRDDATTSLSSFADSSAFANSSSSQGLSLSSVDTDFSNMSSDRGDDYNFYIETEEYEHEHYDDSLHMEQHTRYPPDLALAAASAHAPLLSETIEPQQQPQQQQQRSIQSLIDNEDWTELITLVEHDPDVCRQRVHMIFQGENITCLPLHAVMGRRGANKLPLSVVDCLVTTYPAALMRKDEGGDRLPLHMAILKGASMGVIRYLLEAYPVVLEKADCEGNLPLHYAVMYSSEPIIRLVADRYPAASQHANLKERMPLHLLCARNWDHQDLDLISLDQIRCIFNSWPTAARHADRNGCLPLHVACSQPQPRWDVLELLVEAYPEGLLHKDDEDRIPLQISRRIASSATLSSTSTSTSTTPTAFGRDNDVVLAYLRDKSKQEKRKHLLERIFAIRIMIANVARTHTSASTHNTNAQ
jgi:hypothetical protein